MVNRMDKRCVDIVDIDDVLDLFGINDEDIYAKETIEDALYEGTLKVYKLPSAERRGRWEQVGDNAYRCSACGEISCCNSPFCSECGADMREAKNGCEDCFIPMFYNLEDDDSICRDCGVGE